MISPIAKPTPPSLPLDPPSSRRPLQFTLLGLLVLVTVVAIGLSAIVAFGRAYGIGPPEAVGMMLLSLIMRIPEVLVWMIGAVVVCCRRNLHPAVSWLTLVAIGGLLLSTASYGFVNMWFSFRIRSGGTPSPSDLATLMVARDVVSSLLQAACWVLLFIALLGWRDSHVVRPTVVPEGADVGPH